MKYSLGKHITCIAIAALVIFLIPIPSGFAAIEVKEGDWAKYVIELEISEGIAELMEFEEFDIMEWVKVEVESVSGTSITLKMITHFENGTEHTDTMPGTGFIVDTDLAEGDDVSTPMFGSEMPTKIAGSKTQTYAGASREVYYVDLEQEEMGLSTDLEACWDKATGVLCEMDMSMSGDFLGQTIAMSMSIRMTETNMWEAGLFSGQELLILVVIAIVAVAVAGSAILLLRRKKTSLPEVAPTPVEQGEPVTQQFGNA